MKKDKYEDNPNKTALVLFDELMRLSRQRDKLGKQIMGIHKKIEEFCIHNDTEDLYEYHEGSYLNKSEYVYFTRCRLCGKTFNTRTEIGGFV
jgi:hypothetical protein